MLLDKVAVISSGFAPSACPLVFALSKAALIDDCKAAFPVAIIGIYSPKILFDLMLGISASLSFIAESNVETALFICSDGAPYPGVV
jgi:hypothetical protein